MTMRQRELPAARLSGAAAEAWIPHTCFKHGPPGRVGIELELLTHDRRDPWLPTDGSAFDPFRRVARTAPATGRVTVEPGGQIELSSRPHDHLTSVLAEVAGDLARLRRLAADHRAELTGLGVDERPVRRRVLADPRYSAMESYLDRWGPAGRTMMRRTASLQVNLEASGAGADDVERRWHLLHTVGPVLVAAFANSRGGLDGPWPGWSCSRMGVWLSLDPARTHEPSRRPGETVPQVWTRWCLDAPLMLVRRSEGHWTAPTATFRDWVEGGRAVVPDRPGPTLDDLAYHLTTLFPPVRARGHLEVRYVDAQPGDWWPVPPAVLWALVTDRSAGDRAMAACASQRGRWRDAARLGLRDGALAAAAVEVMDAAAGALAADPTTARWAGLVESFREHWTARGRSPGDDRAEGRAAPSTPALPTPALAPSRPRRSRPVSRKDQPC